jgi:hypothetical protein
MAQMYWKAAEAEDIANDYLRYHPDLVGANIAFVFKEKATKSDGRPIVGKSFKVPAKYQPLMEENDDGTRGYDFMIVLGADIWTELNNDNKEAWVDFLLEQCYGEEDKQGNMKWKTRKPEVQAFPVILARHGTNWDQGVNKLSVIDIGRKQTKVQEPTVRSQDTDADTDTESDVSVNS